MSTNSQILQRFLRNPQEPLNENEIQQLERALADYDRVVDFTKSLQDGQGEIRARRAELETPPGNPYMVYWFDSDIPDTFTISNATWTALDLTDARLTIKKDSWCVVRMIGTKIYPFSPSAYIQILGRINFYPNATGLRLASIAYYDSTGALIERRSLSGETTIGGSAGTDLIIAGFRPAGLSVSADVNQYFQIEVYQNSGADLGVTGIDLILSLAYK